jgi:hypothetical protein
MCFFRSKKKPNLTIHRARQNAKDRSEWFCAKCCIRYGNCPLLDGRLSNADIDWINRFDVRKCKYYMRK